MKYIKYLCVFLVVFSFCGCSNKEYSANDFEENINDINLSDSFSSRDNVVIEKFEMIRNDISDSIDSSNLLDKGKSFFVNCVDFLFYDGEIDGIKFDDMTEGAKKFLLGIVSDIDDLICSKFPNYKEDISSMAGSIYNRASEIIKSGSNNLKNFSRDKLGVDNYNKLSEYITEFKSQVSSDIDSIGDVIDSSKSKVKDWYHNFKGQD